MNKTFTISAIAMFAVMLGMSAVAPVLADPPEGNKVFICHNQTKDKIIDEIVQPVGWYPQEVSERSLQKHLKHGDVQIDDSNAPAEGTITTTDCLALNVP